MKYVALLRGINLGTKSVSMARLREVLSEIGFENPHTLLASGNAVFDAKEKNPEIVRQKLETALEKEFKFHVDVIMRTMPDIQELVAADPFKNEKVTKNTRQHITFLSTMVKHRISGQVWEKFSVVKFAPAEICWAIESSPKLKTPDVMSMLEEIYGKRITTRTWNTVQKIARLAA